MKILITGGAGFVGSSLANLFRDEFPTAKIVCLDNLRRRGSELNVRIFKERNIQFVHGDIRNPSDLSDLHETFDVMIEASAEPSVHAGAQGDPSYVLHTNLVGSLNCFEFARKYVDRTIFLSTSRVYSISALNSIQLETHGNRFVPVPNQNLQGFSSCGIAENFCVAKAKSIYGASKLASELMALEYLNSYGTKIIINRCGVIAGRGQFGKVDQGVFTLWVANHYFGKPLKYIGYGGQGLQVRDLVHPRDLYTLMKSQLEMAESCAGEVYNIGGGLSVSTSLSEYTEHCRRITEREVEIACEPNTNQLDVPLYLTDSSKAEKTFGWKPALDSAGIVEDIYNWIHDNESDLRPIFA
ncbi:NAD-dependent epimerase/dehydratase family protein [Oligoflexus tunisiensis]|uniref:NAD-dependent epimerase/dehydratase family protein n=1 Tax=Oligoflexus tunisiensis TaxID=708132 RepID=UPI000A85C26D|nr:NAD-dependent epimerase/dehydratase family protein [Oligoflexus tunisiensis]